MKKSAHLTANFEMDRSHCNHLFIVNLVLIYCVIWQWTKQLFQHRKSERPQCTRSRKKMIHLSISMPTIFFRAFNIWRLWRTRPTVRNLFYTWNDAHFVFKYIFHNHNIMCVCVWLFIGFDWDDENHHIVIAHTSILHRERERECWIQ